jgi:hypothetical protein
VVAAVVAVGCLATGCGSTNDAPGASATSTTVHTPAVVAYVPQSLSVPIDPVLVADCVAFVQFGAFMGNALYLGMWNDAGRVVATLADTCRSIGKTAPSTLAAMSAQWAQVQQYIAASHSTSPPNSPPTS